MVSKNTDIFNILAKKHGLHKSVVSMICNHPFIFASRRMSDPNDEKALMFAYLFKIKLKNLIVGKKKIMYDEKKERISNKECGIESI
jgi:hypothetical protein